MARLTDDIAFNLEGGSRLSARYSPDPESPRYLSHGAQALRYAGNPEHLAAMKHLGNTAKMIVVHGADDDVCPVQDAREMVANMEAAGLDVEAVWVTRERLDGETFTSTGHAMGDRTRIVFYAADTYLTPGSPRLVVRGGLADFERREPVRYEVPGGAYVISYENGYPVGRFERSN
jgi:predicted peptidase